jgi:hypothetical protein
MFARASFRAARRRGASESQVNLLSEGQHARVLQLPVLRREQNADTSTEYALRAAADFEVTS